MVGDSKELVSTLERRIDAFKSSGRMWQDVKDLHRFKQDKINHVKKKSTLTKKLYAVDTYLEKGCQLSSMMNRWVCQLYSRAGLMPRRTWLIRNIFHDFCPFCFVLYFLTNWFSFIFFGLYFIIFLENEETWSWIGRSIAKILEELGKGRMIIKIYCVEIKICKVKFYERKRQTWAKIKGRKLFLLRTPK